MLGYSIHQYMTTRENDKLRDENTKLKRQLGLLQKDNERLLGELTFMEGIQGFGNSMIGNMYIKVKDGSKVWIDKLRVTKQILLELDKDEDVIQWLEDVNIKFKDNDW